MNRRRAVGLVVAVALLAFPGSVVHAEAADPRFMTKTEIQLLQEALIWTSSYSALKDGVWGRIASAAVQEWRRTNNLPPSDVFDDEEIRLLLAQGIRERRSMGWTAYRDERTGVWIGYPGQIVQPQPFRPTNTGMPITTLRGVDTTLELSLFGPGLTLSALRVMLADMLQKPDINQVDYRLDRVDRQVLSTNMKDDTVRYIRFDRDGDVWRGFVIKVASSRADVGRLICAVSADFSAGGRPVIDEVWNTPRLGPVLANGPTVGKITPRAPPEPTLPTVDIPPPRR